MDQIAKIAESSDEPPVPPSESVPVPQPTEKEISVTIADLTQLAWAHAALDSLSDILESAQDKQILSDVRALETRARSQLDSIASIIVKDKTLLNELLSSHDGHRDAIELVSLVGLVGLRKIDTGLVSSILDSVRDKQVKKRLLRSPEDDRRHSIDMTIRLAQVNSLMKGRDSVEPFLDAALEYSTKYSVLPEWVDPDVKGSGLGEGCSVMAAADLLLLVRRMVAYEDGQDLIILSGIPEDWFMSSTSLSMAAMATKAGRVSVEVGTSANQHQIEVKMEYLPQELEVHVPSSRAMPMVKIYGGGVAGRFHSETSPHVRVVPLSNNVVVTFHR
jgi:hypothetical protein